MSAAITEVAIAEVASVVNANPMMLRIIVPPSLNESRPRRADLAEPVVVMVLCWPLDAAVRNGGRVRLSTHDENK
jgi:hypothetical protein